MSYDERTSCRAFVAKSIFGSGCIVEPSRIVLVDRPITVVKIFVLALFAFLATLFSLFAPALISNWAVWRAASFLNALFSLWVIILFAGALLGLFVSIQSMLSRRSLTVDRDSVRYRAYGVVFRRSKTDQGDRSGVKFVVLKSKASDGDRRFQVGLYSDVCLALFPSFFKGVPDAVDFCVANASDSEMEIPIYYGRLSAFGRWLHLN